MSHLSEMALIKFNSQVCQSLSYWRWEGAGGYAALSHTQSLVTSGTTSMFKFGIFPFPTNQAALTTKQTSEQVFENQQVHAQWHCPSIVTARESIHSSQSPILHCCHCCYARQAFTFLHLQPHGNKVFFFDNFNESYSKEKSIQFLERRLHQKELRGKHCNVHLISRMKWTKTTFNSRRRLTVLIGEQAHQRMLLHRPETVHNHFSPRRQHRTFPIVRISLWVVGSQVHTARLSSGH